MYKYIAASFKYNFNMRVVKDVYDDVQNAASQFLKENYGWSLNDIAAMLFVDPILDDDHIVIEVRCELDLDDWDKLCAHLDPVVQKYNKEAYFDMVGPGIAEAWIYEL